MPKLLIATHNPGKVFEFAEMFRNLPIECVSLDEVGITEDIEETGETFEDNARLKAIGYCEMSGLITLADDSGLEVDALGGEPGVYSARYAGPGATAADRNAKLLKNMAEVPADQRTARFRCVIAIATPSGEIYTADGTVEGRINYEPRGELGFGYDPVFFMPEYGATLAELGSPIKNKISHRAKALQAIMPTLSALIRVYQTRGGR
jgi:XTP/dITP diphosphohydrolase